MPRQSGVGPGAGIWIIDGWVDVPQIDFAHESIDVELSGEAREARLTIDRRKDMKGKLFWLFYNNVFSGWIPPNHMMVFLTFKKSVEFCEKGGLWL